MKLEQMILKDEPITLPHIERDAPESDWTNSWERKEIPENLFEFYRTASYFSIDKVPANIKDEKYYLHSLLEELIRGMKSEFYYLNTHLNGLAKYRKIEPKHGNTYDLRREFKLFILSCFCILDQFSEIVSILLNCQDLSFNVGKSDFDHMLIKMKKLPVENEKSGKIVSLQYDYFIKLFEVISKHMNISSEEHNLYKLLKLYRNKFAHLGTESFHIYCAKHDDGNYYYFFPKFGLI